MEKIQELLSLLELLSDEVLELKPKGVLGSTFFLDINGFPYGYQVDDAKFQGSIEDLEKEFLSRMKTSPGKALAWLKTVTHLVSGSVKGVSPLLRGTPAAPPVKVTDKVKVLSRTKVPSSSGTAEYEVCELEGGQWSCTCPHGQSGRSGECKHIRGVKAAQAAPQKIAASATGEAKLRLSGPKPSKTGSIAIMMESPTGEQSIIGYANSREETDAWLSKWLEWAESSDFEASINFLAKENGKKYILLSPGEWELVS